MADWNETCAELKAAFITKNNTWFKANSWSVLIHSWIVEDTWNTAATRFDDLKHTPSKHESSTGVVGSRASGAPFNGVDFFAVSL